MTITAIAEARFWAKVDKSDTCWLWTAYVSANGYGLFWLSGRNVYAHRVAYELANGPIPDGLVTDHLCRVRHCVNPVHLEAVTYSENTLRGVGPELSRQRQVSKTQCPSGHVYDEANTYVTHKGERVCKACHSEGARRRQFEKATS